MNEWVGEICVNSFFDTLFTPYYTGELRGCRKKYILFGKYSVLRTICFRQPTTNFPTTGPAEKQIKDSRAGIRKYLPNAFLSPSDEPTSSLKELNSS